MDQSIRDRLMELDRQRVMVLGGAKKKKAPVKKKAPAKKKTTTKRGAAAPVEKKRLTEAQINKVLNSPIKDVLSTAKLNLAKKYLKGGLVVQGDFEPAGYHKDAYYGYGKGKAKPKRKQTTAQKQNPWVKHYKAYAKKHNVPIKEAMVKSRKTYKGK